jgi:tRNA-splicing ligase RtcB
MITGKDLIEKGYKPGKGFQKAIDAANKAPDNANIWDIVEDMKPKDIPHIPLRSKGSGPFHINIRAENEYEMVNIDKCIETMEELMRTPTIKSGAIMPDTCPAGSIGTIPVGGIVASTDIHPGMHSADICCSMFYTNYGDTDPKKLLDAVHDVTHFGPGGRDDIVDIDENLLQAFKGNKFLKRYIQQARQHFATQGDGNHFAYVGKLKSTSDTVLVTHHGSRAPGAKLYKEGMKIAESYRVKISPETLKQNAWIPADTEDGKEYWNALQIIREWTKANHTVIHDMAAEKIGAKHIDRFWNEHNFVFKKSDELFYHAKGATPAFDEWADDATDLTIIPLNMAEPILIVRGKNADNGLGFSPHGAGRNYSRTAHKRMLGEKTEQDAFLEETNGIDARFYMGIPDASELPSAYKNAKAVKAQIFEYGLAEIVDEVMPYGCIMAGDWEKEAPWRKKK